MLFFDFLYVLHEHKFLQDDLRPNNFLINALVKARYAPKILGETALNSWGEILEIIRKIKASKEEIKEN